MIKLAIAAAAVAFGLSVAGTGTAIAAEPANHACLGTDFSGYAKSFQPLGQARKAFEVNGVPVLQGGLGDEIQAHLAGLVPDSILPNSCND